MPVGNIIVKKLICIEVDVESTHDCAEYIRLNLFH